MKLPQLFQCDHLGASPCMVLLAQTWAELLFHGLLSANAIPFHESYPVIYAKSGDIVVGFIVYSIDSNRGECWIWLAGVMPRFRAKGIYRQLYDRLRRIAKAAGCDALAGGIGSGNKVAQAAALKRSRKQIAGIWEERL
jgi:hypothetical protein